MLDQIMGFGTILYAFMKIFFSMFRVHGNNKRERRINEAVQKVAAQNNRIVQIKEVSTKLQSGQRVDHKELTECIRLIEQAALSLDQSDRLMVLEELYHPEEEKRLAYVANLLMNASKPPQ